MPEAVLAPRARIECRSAEWLVRSLGRSSDGQQVVDVVGVSPFLREKEARFLVDVEKAAGSFKVLQPEATELVCDPSPQYRDSLLFIEAHLRRTIPTDASLAVGDRAAMDALPYQLQPAAKALAMPRQRLLIADAVGLGKTLECGILCSNVQKELARDFFKVRLWSRKELLEKLFRYYDSFPEDIRLALHLKKDWMVAGEAEE